MPIYYYEGNPIAAPLVIESNEPVFASDASNLVQQRVSQGAQRWEISFEIKNQGGFEQDYFINLVTNAGNVRTMIMPQLLAVDKLVTLTESPNVVGAHRAGDSTVRVSFSTSGGLLPKGSFIQFTNHPKIYMVTANVTANGGERVLNIFPKLYRNLTNGAGVRHAGSASSPQLNYFPALDNLNGIKYEDGILYNPGTIKLIEAI